MGCIYFSAYMAMLSDFSPHTAHQACLTAHHDHSRALESMGTSFIIINIVISFSFYPFHIIICCILGTMMGLPLNGWLYLNELDLQIVQFSLRFQHVINRPALAHRSGFFSDDHSVGEHTESSSSYF